MESDELDSAMDEFNSVLKKVSSSTRAAAVEEVKKITNNMKEKPNVTASEAKSWLGNLKNLLIKAGGEVARWIKETFNHITDKCVIM